MIEIPKKLKRFAIKEKFLPHETALKEIDALARDSEVKNLLSKFENKIDVNITSSDVEIGLGKNDLFVSWYGSMNSKFVKLDLRWEFRDGKTYNHILATDKDGNEEEVLEL